LTKTAYVDRKNNLMVFWTPKVGCSSLVDWFARNPGGLTQEQAYGIPGAPLHPRRWLAENGFEVQEPWKNEILSDFRKIVFYRDPFSRAVSAYLDKFVGINKRKHLNSSTLEGFALNFWTKHFGEEPYTGITFEEFLEVVRDQIAARAPTTSADLDTHWNTQALFPDETDVTGLYNEVYNISEMSRVLTELNASYGYDNSPSRRRSMKYSEFDGNYYGDVASVTLADRVGTFHQDNFRNPKTEMLVQEAYARDYEFFDLNPAPAK
jgi:hypothetical protein